MHLLLVLVLLFPLAGTAFAHDFASGLVLIGHPWIRMPPPGAKTAAGYLTIRNDSGQSIALLSVESGLSASASIHETANVDGVARMRELTQGVTVAANAAITFAPGGTHIMFTELKQKLAVGEMVPAALVFTSGQRVMVNFKVEPIGFSLPAPATSHDGH